MTTGCYFCLGEVWVQLRLDLFQFRPVTEELFQYPMITSCLRTGCFNRLSPKCWKSAWEKCQHPTAVPLRELKHPLGARERPVSMNAVRGTEVSRSFSAAAVGSANAAREQQETRSHGGTRAPLVKLQPTLLDSHLRVRRPRHAQGLCPHTGAQQRLAAHAWAGCGVSAGAAADGRG